MFVDYENCVGSLGRNLAGKLFIAFIMYGDS